MFVNDSLHLNSCHSPVSGGGGRSRLREGAGALRCARNASLLHKLNPALQMSAAKVLKCVFTCEERREEERESAGVGGWRCKTLTGSKNA